jgi:anaphase-promoting complex subunit 2
MQQQQAEQMKVFWKVSLYFLELDAPSESSFHLQFIEGMLTNLGSLSLDRIQTMLKFAPGYDRGIDELAGFMDAARRQGLVIDRDGLWRLNR